MAVPVRIDVAGDGRFINLRATVSTSEAAIALGVKRRVVCSYICGGLLDAVQVGRSYRIRTQSLERLLTLGSVKVRDELGKPDEQSVMPVRNLEQDSFRARLVQQMLDRDAERSAYAMPIV